ncbi:HNH endonuclease [Kitasatospora sp. NPDC056327]|uniref:HNH endonuclease n=1 Tax=Kitasatospora sp. NPDC056327 TaxID=3345785 RepID=UPI0035D92BC6
MHKGILSPASVVRAIEECDRTGAPAFREAYGYGSALDYVLEYRGRTYDSKAIAGVAHRYEYGRPLAHDEFSGGRTGAAAWLRRIGFVVKQMRNPSWTVDETVLACALVVGNGWEAPAPADPRVLELSAFLQRMTAGDETRGGPFQNPDGVARKAVELVAARPGAAGNGGPDGTATTEETVARAFTDRPAEMLEAARGIRALVGSTDFVPARETEGEPEEFEAPEGRLLLRQHLRRERDSRLRGRKIESVLARGGSLACEVCGFDFEQVYGERGAGYVECHHIVPLHVAGESTTRLADLALICSNCHRMIHRRAPWPTPRELRATLAASTRIPPQAAGPAPADRPTP